MRIYGMETEYAVIFVPDEDHGRVPRRIDIYKALERLLSENFGTIKAKYRKEGIFLENGALVNYEARAENFFEGLIEISTPECSSPRELAVYHHALDRILIRMRGHIEKRLNEDGFSGRLILGKNCTDNKGNFYGTHENYLVYDPPGFLRLALLYILVPLLWLINLPFLLVAYLPLCFPLFLIAVYVLFMLFLLLMESLSPGNYLLEELSSLLGKIERYFAERGQDLIRFYGRYVRLITLPWVRIYSRLLNMLVLRRFVKELTPFLITRPIFSGAGRVTLGSVSSTKREREPYDGGFAISQKAEGIRTLSTIFYDDEFRPIYDLHSFLLEPLSVFRPLKRLHILCSDSNMSSLATWLKVGTVGLILEMIEAGERFPEVYLASPLEALHQVSRDPLLRSLLRLRGGGTASALQIQRFYLERAKKFFARKQGLDPETDALIRKWEYMLSCLWPNPHLLYKEVEWVAKRDLLEEAMRGVSSLAELKSIEVWFNELERKRIDFESPQILSEPAMHLRARLGAELFEGLSRFLSRANLSFERFLHLCALVNRLKKIDLKFHEQDPEEGYYFRLVSSGLIEEILTEDEIDTATRMAPPGTRARIRGYLVKKYHSLDPGNRIGWGKCILQGPRRKINFPDPFQNGLPEL